MTNHQEQQACKDNTDNSQTILLGSFRQTQKIPVEDILKQFSKQTQQYTNNEQLNNVPAGNSTSDTQKSTQHNVTSVWIWQIQADAQNRCTVVNTVWMGCADDIL